MIILLNTNMLSLRSPPVLQELLEMGNTCYYFSVEASLLYITNANKCFTLFQSNFPEKKKKSERFISERK